MKYYIYKLTFSSGATYIGSHIQKKENDGYITSSYYYKNFSKEDTLIKREILLFCDDAEQMNIMETICIISDKCNSKNNVNGNYGNWYYNFCGGRVFRGLKLSEEHKRKISKNFFKKGRKPTEEQKQKTKEKLSHKVYCLEDNKIYNSCSDASKNANRSAKSKGYLKASDGRHYLYLKDAEDILDKQKYLKNILDKVPMGKPILCIEEGVYYSSISNARKITGISSIEDFLLGRKGYNTGGGYHWKWVSLEEYENSSLDKRNIPIQIKKYNHNSKKVLCIETGKIYNSIADAGLKRVYKCINNPKFTAGGYHWKLVE